MKVSCIILAAGNGTRMQSDQPKVLHAIAEKPMISILADTLSKSIVYRNIFVTGYKAELVEEELVGRGEVVRQNEQLGTGHAVLQAKTFFENSDDWVIILCGDAPLISFATIDHFVQFAQDQKQGAVLTMDVEDPTGYGRVIQDNAGHVLRIIEEKSATEEEKQITQVNTGVFCLSAKNLFEALDLVKDDNSQKEYYLTDIVKILNDKGCSLKAHVLKNHSEALGINSRKELAFAEKYIQEKNLARFMDQGVTIIVPEQTYIAEDVEIGIGTVIKSFVHIGRGAKIGENCIIGPLVAVEPGEVIAHYEVKNTQVTVKE